MNSHFNHLKQQAGIVLLEGLIAILIFSLGILALVGTQAVAVKQSTDAQYRTEAGQLVNQLVGTMWASDRTTATLKANFQTGGAGYNTWLADVSATLPGVDTFPPTVVVSDVAPNEGLVTITVFWRSPSESSTAAPHNYVSVARLR
ncbi:pilus assembly protein PilV [Noviherbaspirillum saxi]|uniref:Pilus assembly protein PilV n=1 Tax=Noviherbaspirillum saxi TaxID=2320863 RepID=A0A3A3FTW3_9BURK|nr:pilus assembly protein PilV [Noviherbaspirillum saxi]RJF98970.1 pilus assembly protein PilV [Noviherbaspirillum saxi]